MLYVVDSVTRKWLEQAKQLSQVVNSAAPDGTFAAGVNRVTELMPILMNDIILSAPEDQKVRLHSLYKGYFIMPDGFVTERGHHYCSNATQLLVILGLHTVSRRRS